MISKDRPFINSKSMLRPKSNLVFNYQDNLGSSKKIMGIGRDRRKVSSYFKGCCYSDKMETCHQIWERQFFFLSSIGSCTFYRHWMISIENPRETICQDGKLKEKVLLFLNPLLTMKIVGQSQRFLVWSFGFFVLKENTTWLPTN